MKSIKLSPLAFVISLTVLPSVHAADFSFKFSWCESTPEFVLSNIPKTTAKLDLKMQDLDVPSFNHGGAVIAYAGNNGKAKIECGAFISQTWYPPTPPSGSHTYQWTIRALDKNGKDLATAMAQRKFPE